MTFDEVCEVAKRFDADERFVVVAIGRFEVLTDILAYPRAFKFAWGVNVVSLIDHEYKAILRDVAKVDEFIAAAPQPKPKAKPTLAASATKKPATAQLSLLLE